MPGGAGRAALGAGGCRGRRAAARRASWCSPSRPSASSWPASTCPPRRSACSSRSPPSSRAAAMAAVLFPDPGSRAFGLSLLVLVVWLAPRDVARHTVHSTGQPRFCAAAMLAGYAWLAVAGVAWAVSRGDHHPGRPRRRGAHDLPGVRHEHGAGARAGHPARRAPPPGALPAAALGAPRRAARGPARAGGRRPAGRPVLVAAGGYGTAAALLLLPLAAVLTATLPPHRAPRPRRPPAPAPLVRS